MKILLVSDVESSYIWDHFQPEKFKDVGLVISCGDLKTEYLSLIVTMIKAPLFYVPGNHDTGYEKNPPEGCDCIDGKLVNYRGIRILGLGGSMKYNGNPPYQYTEREMEWRTKKLRWSLMVNGGLDMLITHAPALGISDGEDICHKGFKCFLNLIDRYSPKYHIHGHMHLNYGLKKRIFAYKDTTVINAYDHCLIEYGSLGDTTRL